MSVFGGGLLQKVISFISNYLQAGLKFSRSCPALSSGGKKNPISVLDGLEQHPEDRWVLGNVVRINNILLLCNIMYSRVSICKKQSVYWMTRLL